MVTLLKKLFARRLAAATPEGERRFYGTLCSVLGIVLNVCLFLGKYVAGVLSGSIAVMADAFNNLGDAASSLITLVGFRLAGQKPDSKHPFGHGRIEYLSGLAVSMLIVVVGAELLLSSAEKIMFPAVVDVSGVTIGILAASICVKGYMFFYNHRVGIKIDSAGMKATAADSISDTVATAAVLLAALAQRFFGWQIDGYVGALVALFIVYTGCRSVWETIQPLLGQMPDPALVKKIESTVLSYDEVCGIHDLVIHDYGPGRCMISLHAEVDGSEDVFVTHDAIDRIERRLCEELGCEAVIHMDPIVTNDETVRVLRNTVEAALVQLHPSITVHDFRTVAGPTHTNVIFDMVVPYDLQETEDVLIEQAQALINAADPCLFAVIQVDRAYTE